MRVLIACEFSGIVRNEFIKAGHTAVSCDLLPTEIPGPHVQGDVLELIDGEWDMMIAFPPCTYLTKSNAWRWSAIANERDEALRFVTCLMEAPISRIAIENPVGAVGSNIRPADQYVDPWQFGDPFQKRTGLWLKGLPALIPDITRRPDDVVPWCQAGYGPRRSGGTRKPGGVARSVTDRNRTFPGIAHAMAQQWGV